MATKPKNNAKTMTMVTKIFMWNITPAVADSVFAWGNVALIVGAFLVAAGTIVTIKMADLRDHFSDLRISEDERETAIAKSVAAKATDDAAQAQKSTEIIRKANLALQQDLQSENEARQKLEEKLAPRHLTSSESQVITSSLLPLSGAQIDVQSPMGNDEARGYADDFANALRGAGWIIGQGGGETRVINGGPPQYGIFIIVNTQDVQNGVIPEAAKLLALVLQSLGISVKLENGSAVPLNDVWLFIASKPT